MMRWERSNAVIAQRLSCNQLKGIFSKKILVGKNEHAFLEKNGKIIEEFENRPCKACGLFSRHSVFVYMLDKGEKELRRPINDVWTKDRKSMDLSVSIKFFINAYGLFIEHFMRNKSIIVLEDIWESIRECVISKVIGPVISSSILKDVQTSSGIDSIIGDSVGRILIPEMAEKGLTLKSISVTPVMFDDAPGETEEEEKIRAAELAKKTEELKSKGLDREAAIAEMEAEMIRREAQMQLEREETQNDMEEALEALELKDIKDKQKLLAEIEKMKENIAPQKEVVEETIKSLEHEIEHLRNSRDLAEKKLYKHEISEEAFKRLADKYETKIIELKTKIDALKKT